MNRILPIGTKVSVQRKISKEFPPFLGTIKSKPFWSARSQCECYHVLFDHTYKMKLIGEPDIENEPRFWHVIEAHRVIGPDIIEDIMT